MIILTETELHALVVKGIEAGVDMNDDQLANGIADIIIQEAELDTQIWSKTYNGFEDLADMGRDVDEAFHPDMNPASESLPPEFTGNVRVAITYEEEKIEDDREV